MSILKHDTKPRLPGQYLITLVSIAVFLIKPNLGRRILIVLPTRLFSMLVTLALDLLHLAIENSSSSETAKEVPSHPHRTQRTSRNKNKY